MVSTRRRWRLFRPWIVKPSSRVLRKLSGELTTIQYWSDRPSERPDLRLRLERPGLRVPSAEVSGASDSSDAPVSLLAIGRSSRGLHGAQVFMLGQEGCEVAYLGDVCHLVARHHPADLEQAERAAARIRDRAVPLVLAPAMKEVDRPPPHPREILQRFLQRSVEVLVLCGVDRGPNVRDGQAIEVGMAQQAVDTGS